MELVTGATSRLLPKLGALLQDEYQLQDKVRKDIESLQNELMFMNATLRMVAEVPRDQLDEHVRIWAVIIKEVSYDMEDVVSIFVARVHGAPHLDGLITKFFNMFCMGRTHHQIAGIVEEIKSLIKEVGDLRDRYRFDNIVTRAAAPVVLLQRENTLTRYLADDCEEITRRHIGIKYEEPVGIEEHMKVLHNWITPGDDHVGMLAILGPAGVGKTTIAMALYQNYGDQFQHRAMVNVSQYSGNPGTALVNILRQVTHQALQGYGVDVQGYYGDKNIYIEDMARYDLHKRLKGRRLLLLLEDVTSAVLLHEIRKSLPHGVSGSKIIVTTRFDSVATAIGMGMEDCVHKLGSLSDKKARQLFMEVVGKENHEKISPRLWGMCGGLPLAIVKMAGQFACNPWKSEEEWYTLCSCLKPSLGSSDTAYQLNGILKACYDDMPVEIKTCSLYLSIFPRGKNISRKRLTRRWISEGFVNEQQGMSAEEVADAYLNHLIRRKVLHAVEHGRNGKVKTYQVHGAVLEYIASKASEENFVTTIGGSIMPAPSSKIRRLSVQCSGLTYGKEELETMNLSHVRDLTVFGSVKNLPFSSIKFGVVHVLDLEGCKDFKQHRTKEIYKMLLLKYLSLRGTGIKKLTKGIGDLRYLETLDVRETDVIELPKAICKLERLVNIFGGNKRTRKGFKLPIELGKREKMKALRILTGIEISEETIGDLHRLTGLRKLAIYKVDINKGNLHFRELSSLIKYLGCYSLRALVIHDESAEFLKSLGQLSSPPKLLNALELSGKLIELRNG